MLAKCLSYVVSILTGFRILFLRVKSLKWKLKELTMSAKSIMDISVDSMIIFSNRTGYYMDKKIVGKEDETR